MFVILPNRRDLRRIAAREILPRIITQLFHAERNTLAFAIELEDLDVDLVADGRPPLTDA